MYECNDPLRLHVLKTKIHAMSYRFVRCIKPNPDKETRFDGEDVLLQLQYSGTMETIRIRQQVGTTPSSTSFPEHLSPGGRRFSLPQRCSCGHGQQLSSCTY